VGLICKNTRQRIDRLSAHAQHHGTKPVCTRYWHTHSVLAVFLGTEHEGAARRRHLARQQLLRTTSPISPRRRPRVDGCNADGCNAHRPTRRVIVRAHGSVKTPRIARHRKSKYGLGKGGALYHHSSIALEHSGTCNVKTSVGVGWRQHTCTREQEASVDSVKSYNSRQCVVL
jgi:hypothetical protein